MSCKRLKAGLPLVKIPVSGANQSDIRKEQEQVELFRDMFLSAVSELGRLYLDGILGIVRNHNENVPITTTVNEKISIRNLMTLFEDFEAGLNDLTADLNWNLEHAVEDE